MKLLDIRREGSPHIFFSIPQEKPDNTSVSRTRFQARFFQKNIFRGHKYSGEWTIFYWQRIMKWVKRYPIAMLLWYQCLHDHFTSKLLVESTLMPILMIRRSSFLFFSDVVYYHLNRALKPLQRVVRRRRASILDQYLTVVNCMF